MVAQISPVHTMFQYSISAFQPSAFPFNLFNKNQGSEYEENGKSKQKGFHANVSTRVNLMQSLQTSAGSTDTRLESSVVNVDYLSNSALARGNVLPFCFKIGGGFLHSRWEDAQITTPFAHITFIFPFGEPSAIINQANWYKASNWRLAAGVGMRYSHYGTSFKVTYQHPLDGDLLNYLKENEFKFSTMTISAALINIRGLYLGVGYNRKFSERFGALNPQTNLKTTINEANLLAQFAWGKEVTRTAPRSFATHHHTNLVMYKLMYSLNQPTTYPLYWQLNHRFSLDNTLWLGGGYNAAHRFQIQFGHLNINLKEQEWQIWLTAEMSNSLFVKADAFKQGALEISLGGVF